MFTLKNKRTKVSLLFGLCAFLLNLWGTLTFPVIDDEAYYWNWAQNLDWGYYDHPPMVAFWIYLGDFLGNTRLGLRLVNCLLMAGAVALLTHWANPTKKKDILFWLGLIFSQTLFSLYGFITTPDGPLLVFTICLLWSQSQQKYLNTYAYILIVGICSAGLVYSKYHSALIIALASLPMLYNLRDHWRWFLGLSLGAFLYIPHLLWQHNHDWVSFTYHLSNRVQNESFEPRFTYEYLLNFLWAGSPLLLVFFLKAYFKTSWRNARNTPLLWTTAGLFLFFLFSTLSRATQPQWIVVIYPLLALITFKYYQSKGIPKIGVKLGQLGIILLICARILFSFPDTIIKTPFHGTKEFMGKAAEIKGIAIWEKYQTTSLYNFHNHPKKAINYATVGNRESQYDLWKTPYRLDAEEGPFVYFSRYAKGWPDSLVWENNKRTAYHYKTLNAVSALPTLHIEVIERKQEGDSTRLTLSLSNQSTKNNTGYKKETPISFVIRYMKNRHEGIYREPLVLPEFKIKPGRKITLQTSYKEFTKPGIYKAYIATQPENLPDRMRTKWLEFGVK